MGRLAYEIASMGFHSEGNEFSYFMLFTSNYILNGSDINNQQKIFPWILETCNLDNRMIELNSFDELVEQKIEYSLPRIRLVVH